MSCPNLYIRVCSYLWHRVQGIVDEFATLYEPNTTHWSSIEEVDDALNFTKIVSQTGAEYLQSYGVSHSFTYELVEAATRVDYAQVGQTSCC